jgi:hypothetical protein
MQGTTTLSIQGILKTEYILNNTVQIYNDGQV